jgi:hypothetical protein
MKKICVFVAVLAVFGLCLPTVQAATEAEIQAAIDDGLAWLAAKQNVSPGSDSGSWGGQRKTGKTGLAIKKFEHDAILRGYPSPFDPGYMYHEVVERGFYYLFDKAATVSISVQTHGDPDSDGDGIGVAFAGGSTYETGIALMAIVESNTPGRVVDRPGSAVDGWTYYDVAVDVMDWLAYAQTDFGTYEGGWWYDAMNNADFMGDQSNSGFATLGLAFAEAAAPHGFGLSVPQFVKDELGDPGLWIDYIQNDVDGDQYDGGSSYFDPNDTLPGYQTVNILETGNLIFEMAWYGDDPTTQRVVDAIDYIVRHWTDPGYTWPDPQGWHGNYLAMFTMMKGFEAFGIDLIDGIDWFDEVSDSIVANQHANGSWGPDFWDDFVEGGPGHGDTVLSTTWALLTLQKAAPEIVVPVELDIKPQSCPNPLRTNSRGVMPVAILGTDEFDVYDVDPATVLLEGVAPIRWYLQDVATPVEPGGDSCDCTTEGPDGFMDLTLKFVNQDLIDSLEARLGRPVEDREFLVLTLTGLTYDSTKIEGHDCVRIVRKIKAIPITNEIACQVSLEGNYPNPFNPETDVSFSLSERTEVLLVVYNILGERVKTLLNGEVEAGIHSIHWDGRDEAGDPVATGVYFYRLKADGFDQTRKMVLMK